MAHARGRKRPRVEADGGFSDLLGRFEASVQSAPAGAGALLEAWRQLQQLQASVERRLVTCSIDSLTPHDAVEFTSTAGG
ncbi:unnamed protein product [Prorocentrum cordatum]|uniref:Uncharacterized protein n=1 Tax=Prorocentrum cordatum TaxID=2364126 RepID=A0ABN9XIA2_9DINO|nr:unnamed protein product [Polarella glacialis]